MTKRVRFLTRQFILAALACVCLLLVGCEDGSSDAPPIRRSTIELRALHNRGVGLMGQFNYGEAAKVFEQLAAESPQAVDTQVDLAIALLNRREENDLMRSARLLDEVIELAPENLRAKYCRALLYFNDGQSEQASRLFQQVAQADPTDGYAVYYVGQCLFAAGEFAAALEKYQEAQATDPYLRSAYYGAFQSAQRLRDREEMQANLATFQRLADNPRARLAELKYTRMGPKAVVRAGNDESLADNVQPRSGPTFLAAAPLEITSAADVDWAGTSAASLTVADIDGDRLWDIFIAGGGERNVVLLQRDGKFELQPEHPLATVRDVVAPLWGDFDDDGLVDVYVCRNGPNRLWRQTSAGQWTDVTAIAGAASSNANTVDGACYDADHDGDLDYYLVNADGPNELLNNNRDGTFSPLANELGIAGRVEASRRVVLADLDSDDDLDMLLLSNTPPHEVMINDRLWEYRAGDGFDALCAAAVTGAVAVDADVDGQVELFTIGPHGVSRWATDDRATWQPSSLIEFDDDSPRPTELAVYDFLGYGRMQLATFAPGSWQLFELDGTLIESFQDESLTGDYGVLVGAAGPEVIAARTGGPPVIWRAGEGRGQYVRLRFVGRKDKGQEMRSNASGIGVQGAARIGTTWVPIPVSRLESGPGQSLQPVAVGVGIAEKIDFLQLLWPDGVSQSELDLRFGELHVIEETQRQAGSCPLVFVWNGERFEFVADILGAGGIGFNLGKGEYYDPRPTENLLLPPGMLQPIGARLVVKLGEPMEEICYFDAVRLVAYDIPPGWQMTLDERFGGSAPLPTGEPRFFRRELLPTMAINDRGEDVTASLAACDRRAAPLGRTDRRFIGLTNPHSLTLTFDTPLDKLDTPVLVFDGWVEYAYSQTAFAAWQAGMVYEEPTIEAMGSDGKWVPVAERFGYMAGTPRQSSVPLPREKLPRETRSLRIRTNMQIYWDRLTVVDVEQNTHVHRQELQLVEARVDDVGFSTRTLHDQRYPVYDYDNRPPFGDARHPSGFYTEIGDALELVTTTDDALAIIGPGEELHLEYTAAAHELPTGWTRRYVVEADGWCKDADLFTKDAGAVEPLPRRFTEPSPEQAARREALHRKYNVRYRSDR